MNRLMESCQNTPALTPRLQWVAGTSIQVHEETENEERKMLDLVTELSANDVGLVQKKHGNGYAGSSELNGTAVSKKLDTSSLPCLSLWLYQTTKKYSTISHSKGEKLQKRSVDT